MASYKFQKPDHIREDGLLVKWQLLIFSLAFVLGNFVGPFLPKTPSDMVFKMVDMFFICGSILLAIKLAREGWDMAASGFTILGIGWGIIFAAMDFEHLKIDMEVRTSAAYFFIPSMIMIAYYKPFPLWLKLLTLWCMVPFTVSLFVQKLYPHDEKLLMQWVLGGFGSFHFLSLIWSIFFYRQYRKQFKASAKTQAENTIS